MSSQEVAVIEDLIGRGFSIGNGDAAEPYVQLLRGVDPEDVEHQVKLAKSASYDDGWKRALEYAESGMKERIATAVDLAERRVHRDYKRARAERRFQNVACVAIALVAIAALLYLSRP